MWLTWHYQARSRNLAKALNLPIYEYFVNDNLIQRHILSSLWTIKVLFTKRPDKIIIQCSFLLLLIVSFYKLLRRNKVVLIVDCHTKALRRKAPGMLNYVFWPLKKFSFKFADLSIISNSDLIKDIKELHNEFLILPDKIPAETVNSDFRYSSKYCVYISSFAIDEPFEEILQVSKLLENSVKIFWTGKYPDKVKNLKSLYTNIEFTGYVPFDDYYNLLGNADCILALTTEEECLQSGAYEALGLEIPMVVSDTKTLRNFFKDTAVYTKHSPDKIAESILKAINNSTSLKNKMKNLKTEKNIEFDNRLRKIFTLISDEK